ncbi:hypothetical protein MRX96_047443 [Rhipicephalus microplus]
MGAADRRASSFAAAWTVHIKSSFIMNGVCVRYRGWIDLDRLDGVGCLEYDEERGRLEDAVLRDQIECYNQRLRDFEEKQRAFRARHERQAEAELESITLKRRALSRQLRGGPRDPPASLSLLVSCASFCERPK